ncbi:armadillo-type protein [Xylariales sp. PMI_506]|nr:armadillo-type protein [Xylariales sp. PMI_506]
MNQIPIPTSLDEVENLVNRLYEPSAAPLVPQIQEVLQKLQKSPDGWQMAEGLLARPADNVKFFGALTFIVKLNTDSIEDSDAESVLLNLMGWLTKSLETGAGPIVIRKLCSALVTHFIHFSHIWPSCIRAVLCCLHVNRGVSEEEVKNGPSIDQAIQALTPQKAVAATWFAASLAEEAEKIDQRSTKYIAFHERLVSNAQDLALLLGHSLLSQTELQLQRESIVCLQSWLLYSQRSPNEQLTSQLRPLLQPVIKCLAIGDLYETTIELLTDTLSNWQAFFTKEDYDLMYALFDSDWSRERYQNLLGGDFDFDSVQFGLFMLAFGDAQISELMDGSNERAQRFLAALVGLLAAEGLPVADDKIFVPALEFWSQFVENLVDNMYSEPENSGNWSTPPLSYITQVVSHCWTKIQYPSLTVWNSWDSTERVSFGDARKDVSDLLQSVYTISGRPLISLFIDLTLQALSNSAWAELEAGAFCLGSLSDCISDENDCDDILSKVFGSQLFDLLRQGQSAVPVRARQTCLYLIERYSDYFTRHAQYLPAALNLLFSAVHDHPLAGPSSKSIWRLCSSCRSLLTSEVDAFIGQYNILRSGQDLDSLAEERVVGGIACIIQAITEEPRRLDAFRKLLVLVGTDIEKSFQLHACNLELSPEDPIMARAYDVAQRPTAVVASLEVSLQLAIRALRCLLSIAKGLQSPTESVVDLDTEQNGSAQINADLAQIQTDIIEILARLKDTFAESSECLDTIRSILIAGFSESEPGPFVFPPQMVTEFIKSPWHSRTASAVSTASIFINSLYNGSNKSQMSSIIGQLLPWALDHLRQIQDPQNEPELAQYGIEFVQKAMTKDPGVFMKSQATTALEFLFMFAIKMLNGNEPLPKAAAAEFWTSFIVLKSTDQETQTAIDVAMNHLGPLLAHSLIQNIGGNASRSELDKLCDPLKKLVVQHVNSRQWLETALNDASFPSDKVGSSEKALFLKKIISLRGTRATNQVVREFWLACRGSSFAYAS